MKKKVITLILAVVIAIGCAVPAAAITVYYNDTPVSWDYGRSWGLWGYSKVMSNVYEHSATVNTTFSGWQDPGELASATQFVGTGTIYAYWNCRG